MNWTKSKATKQSSIKTIVSGRVYAKTRVEGFTKGTFVPLYSENVNQMARITYYALSDSDTKSSLIADYLAGKGLEPIKGKSKKALERARLIRKSEEALSVLQRELYFHIFSLEPKFNYQRNYSDQFSVLVSSFNNTLHVRNPRSLFTIIENFADKLPADSIDKFYDKADAFKEKYQDYNPKAMDEEGSYLEDDSAKWIQFGRDFVSLFEDITVNCTSFDGNLRLLKG